MAYETLVNMPTTKNFSATLHVSVDYIKNKLIAKNVRSLSTFYDVNYSVDQVTDIKDRTGATIFTTTTKLPCIEYSVNSEGSKVYDKYSFTIDGTEYVCDSHSNKLDDTVMDLINTDRVVVRMSKNSFITEKISSVRVNYVDFADDTLIDVLLNTVIPAMADESTDKALAYIASKPKVSEQQRYRYTVKAKIAEKAISGDKQCYSMLDLEAKIKEIDTDVYINDIIKMSSIWSTTADELVVKIEAVRTAVCELLKYDSAKSQDAAYVTNVGKRVHKAINIISLGSNLTAYSSVDSILKLFDNDYNIQ